MRDFEKMMREALLVSKGALRKNIKHRLSQLSTENKTQQSQEVIKKLFALRQFQNSSRISVYLNTKDEVSTIPILQKIFQENKTCYIPRYDKSVMKMVKLNSMEDYEKLPLTKWNIKQPELNENREEALETGGLDLVIVPGVAFTLSGKRLGHGKGYYDIYLSQVAKKQKLPPNTIALSFTEQILPDIPCNEDDFLIDVVLHPDSCPENTE